MFVYDYIFVCAGNRPIKQTAHAQMFENAWKTAHFVFGFENNYQDKIDYFPRNY